MVDDFKVFDLAKHKLFKPYSSTDEVAVAKWSPKK